MYASVSTLQDNMTLKSTELYMYKISSITVLGGLKGYSQCLCLKYGVHSALA